MNDTNETIARLVAERHRAMTPDERMQAAAAMYTAARAIVESSLPAGLSPAEHRLAVARRFYGADVSEGMLRGYAWRGVAPNSATEP